jgi:predicted O-methyltransferase YrrM
MQSIRFAAKYLSYYLKAVDEHSLHSPLIYDIYHNVIKNKLVNPYYAAIEDERKFLLANDEEIELNDLGAGTSNKVVKSRKVSNVARKSIAPAKKSRLLHRLINYCKPDIVLELGTCLGINTLYLALEESTSAVYTFEGCHNTADVANKLWQKFDFTDKINLVEGNIDNTLQHFLADINQIDFAFLDANHTYKATMEYFDAINEKVHHQSIVVIDDIHWSSGMQKAWQEIKQKDNVFLSIDLFHVGIILFTPLYIKQHYILEF